MALFLANAGGEGQVVVATVLVWPG